MQLPWDAGDPGAGIFPPCRRIPSLSKGEQLWQQRFAGLSRIRLSCHQPGDPCGLRGSKGDGKGKKVIADQDSVRLPLPSAPPHSHGEHSPPRRAESLDNCPAINLPLCLTRGIKMSLLFGFFWKTLTDETGVIRLAQEQETWRMQLSPSHVQSSGRDAAPVKPCCQAPWDLALGIRDRGLGLGIGTKKAGMSYNSRLEIQRFPALGAARFWFSLHTRQQKYLPLERG